jgi:high-affinity iron transporter
MGQVLHALMGYVARPAGIQVLAYLTTLLIIGGLMFRFGRSARAQRTPPRYRPKNLSVASRS